MPTNWLFEVERYIQLKRSGNRYVGLCPYHSESTPSCVIYPETNSFHCFGCKQGGSLKKLLKKFGYRIDNEFINLKSFSEKPKPVISPIEERSLIFWQMQLKDDKRRYFHERGFGDNDINYYGFGFAPDYDRFVIPVWEGKPKQSSCTSVRLRARGDVLPKYMGIRGHNEPALFNKHTLKGNQTVFIVFGEIDALSIFKMGYAAVSPTAGAGSFRDEWVDLFEDAERIIVVPDNTAQELISACALSDKFEGRSVIGYWPLDVKDANEYFLKYRSLETFWKENQSLNLEADFLPNLKLV